VCWLYDFLCKGYNKLVDKLDSNDIEHEFKKKVVTEIEPKELDFFQSLFIHHGLDTRRFAYGTTTRRSPASSGTE